MPEADKEKENTEKIVVELTDFLNKKGWLEPEIEKVCEGLAVNVLDEVKR